MKYWAWMARSIKSINDEDTRIILGLLAALIIIFTGVALSFLLAAHFHLAVGIICFIPTVFLGITVPIYIHKGAKK